MKKLALMVLGVTALTASVACATEGSRNNPHLWLGVGLGMDSQTQQWSWTNAQSNAPATSVGNVSTGQIAFTGMFNIGFGVNINRKWHTGLEFIIGGSGYKHSFNTDTTPPATLPDEQGSVRNGFLWGARIRLGYKCNRALFYTLWGFAARRYSINFRTLDAGGAAQVPVVSSKMTRTAFVPGVGMEYALTKRGNVTLGLETFTEVYSKKTYTGAGSSAGSSVSIQPRVFTGLVTCRYKFNW